MKARRAADADDFRNAGLELQNQADRAFKVQMPPNTCRVNGQSHLGEVPRVDAAKDQRSTSQDSFTVCKHESQRGTGDRHNEVNSSSPVTFLQIAHEASFEALRGKASKVQIFRKQLDVRPCRAVENLTHILFDRLDRWQVTPLTVEDEN
jgi:hypothetical protein